MANPYEQMAQSLGEAGVNLSGTKTYSNYEKSQKLAGDDRDDPPPTRPRARPESKDTSESPTISIVDADTDETVANWDVGSGDVTFSGDSSLSETTQRRKKSKSGLAVPEPKINIGPLEIKERDAKLDVSMDWSNVFYNLLEDAMPEGVNLNRFKTSWDGETIKILDVGMSFAEGGKVSDKAQLEMELIMNEQVDPVSGNTAPIGAKPEEVRDDIEIRVSPGEYVINAQTVRYFGEDFFDELQKAAAEGFERIKEGEELPFRDDELATEEDETEEVEPKGFAYGGRVKGYAEGDLVVPEPVGGGYGQYGGTGAMFMGYQSKTFINDETGQKIIIFFFNGRPLSRIPAGFREMGETPAEEQVEAATQISDDNGDPTTTNEAPPTYLNTPVEDWTPDMHSRYALDLETAKKLGKDPFGLTTMESIVVGLLGAVNPLVGVGARALIKKEKEKIAKQVVNNGYQQATTGGLSNKDEMEGYGIMKSYYEAAGALGISKDDPNYFGEDDYNTAFGATTTSYTDAQGVTREVTTYDKDPASKRMVDMAADAYLMTSYASSPKASDPITELVKSVTGQKDDDAPAVTGTGSLVSPTNVQVIEGVATRYGDNNNKDPYSVNTYKAGESSMEQSIAAQSQAYQESGKKFDMNDPSTWATSSNDDSGDNSGSSNDKVLCDLIHRYGYLNEDIWRLDEAFGDRVAIEDPELMEGYHTWAKPMVAWIEKESFLAKLYLKYWCVPFTRRWANHIAHVMEPENYKPDYVGKLMLAIGVPISRAIYKLKGRKLKTV